MKFVSVKEPLLLCQCSLIGVLVKNEDGADVVYWIQWHGKENRPVLNGPVEVSQDLVEVDWSRPVDNRAPERRMDISAEIER